MNKVLAIIILSLTAALIAGWFLGKVSDETFVALAVTGINLVFNLGKTPLQLPVKPPAQ